MLIKTNYTEKPDNKSGLDKVIFYFFLAPIEKKCRTNTEIIRNLKSLTKVKHNYFKGREKYLDSS